MSLCVMYAHLGMMEPGTAAVDRDGEVWCVWPSGHGGLGSPSISPDLLHTTAIYGPFGVLGVGLPSLVCDAACRASKEGDPSRAKAIVLEHLGKPHSDHPCWAELGTESIDGPNGLRRYTRDTRLVGGRLGPDMQPLRRVAVGSKVRRAHAPGVGEVLAGPDAVGRWQVKFSHIPFPLWLDDDLEVVG